MFMTRLLVFTNKLVRNTFGFINEVLLVFTLFFDFHGQIIYSGLQYSPDSLGIILRCLVKKPVQVFKVIILYSVKSIVVDYRPRY
jgi:hypothetical protein